MYTHTTHTTTCTFYFTVTVILCEVLTPPTNGGIVYSNSVSFNSIAVFVCNDDFNLIGTDRRTCLATGEWSGQSPQCIGMCCECSTRVEVNEIEYGDTMSRWDQMKISTHRIPYTRAVLQPHGAITALQFSWFCSVSLFSLKIIILRGQCPHVFKILGASAPTAPMLLPPMLYKIPTAIKVYKYSYIDN